MSELPPLVYTQPDSLAGVLAALERPGARIFAGGTDLIVALKERSAWVASVRELVDIKGVDEARGIHDLGGELRIGALVTAQELASEPIVSRFAMALAEAAAATSAPTLRARGTVGGNLTTPHAAGDVATALLALDATAEVATSPTEVEAVPVEALIGDANQALPGAALILAVRVSKCQAGAFEKQGARRAFTRSRAAVAVALRDGGSRVALAGLASQPFLGPATATAIDLGGDVCTALRTDRANQDSEGHSVPQSLVEALVERASSRALRRG